MYISSRQNWVIVFNDKINEIDYMRWIIDVQNFFCGTLWSSCISLLILLIGNLQKHLLNKQTCNAWLFWMSCYVLKLDGVQYWIKCGAKTSDATIAICFWVMLRFTEANSKALVSPIPRWVASWNAKNRPKGNIPSLSSSDIQSSQNCSIKYALSDFILTSRSKVGFYVFIFCIQSILRHHHQVSKVDNFQIALLFELCNIEQTVAHSMPLYRLPCFLQVYLSLFLLGCLRWHWYEQWDRRKHSINSSMLVRRWSGGNCLTSL